MRLGRIIFIFIISVLLTQFYAVNAMEMEHGKGMEMKGNLKCEICGMGFMKDGKGTFVIELKDGGKKMTDSPNCGIILRHNLATDIKSVKATDYNTKELIDADSAYYVSGADITTKKDKLEKGLMPNSMVAFSTKEAAEAFQKEHGGKVLDYEKAAQHVSGKKMKKHGHGEESEGHGHGHGM